MEVIIAPSSSQVTIFLDKLAFDARMPRIGQSPLPHLGDLEIHYSFLLCLLRSL